MAINKLLSSENKGYNTDEVEFNDFTAPQVYSVKRHTGWNIAFCC